MTNLEEKLLNGKIEITGLPIYDEMVKAINDCYREDEGEKIADPTERLKYYARIAQNLEPERKAIEVRIRAERGARKIMRQEARNEG